MEQMGQMPLQGIRVIDLTIYDGNATCIAPPSLISRTPVSRRSLILPPHFSLLIDCPTHG